MILNVENGRIGNLLFQYIGLKKYFPKHKLIFIGYLDLEQFFDNVDAYFFVIKSVNKFFFRFLRFIILFLAKIHFLGVICENINSKNYKIEVKKGLLWWIVVSHSIFFQHKNVVNQINNPPILKSKIINKGLNWLAKKKINLKKRVMVFAHFRRGDYLEYPSKEFSAVLDLNWYKRAIKLIKKKLYNPIFILFSEDRNYLQDIFINSKSTLISSNKPEIDLSIMSLCSSGILSPSSFSWWGAFYAKISSKNNNYFIAPKYWIGHRSKKWLPKNFKTKWITYI
jgi:hypothetical protein